MSAKFSIEAWSAFAPGLDGQEAWKAWAQAPWLPEGAAVPALAEMPAMQRRRLEKLGRMALQVAWHCQPETEQELPLLFASRHGDLDRTFGMLAGLARDEPLSPTHFGLSTHNAIAAQYSIARGLTGNYLALSAGDQPAEAAVTEAVSLIADGAPGALLVVYSSPTPEAYAHFRDEPETDFAWAWRIGPARAGAPVLSLAPMAPEPVTSERRRLPHGLEVLRFFLSGQARLPTPDGHRCWHRQA